MKRIIVSSGLLLGVWSLGFLGCVIALALLIVPSQSPAQARPPHAVRSSAANTRRSLTVPSAFSVQSFAQLPLRPRPKPVDCTVARCLALTFDDGPNPLASGDILDILKRQDVQVTFFVVGSHVVKNPELVRRMYSQGNLVENHSWGHPFLTKIPPQQIEQEVANTQAAIVASGVPAPTMVRPPYGAVNQTVLDHVHMPLVLWNIDPEDWRQTDPSKITQAVIAQVKPGAIVILHEQHSTASALEPIVIELKKQYQLVTVQQLLGIDVNARGQYFSQFTHR